MLTLFKQKELIRARGRQRTDSTHVLGAVRELNRLELVGETMLRALNGLTKTHPEWLKEVAQPEWFERYGARRASFRLPRSKEKREALAEVIGADGWYLLGLIYDEAAPKNLRHLPAVDTIRLVWLQQYAYEEHEGQGRLRCTGA